MTYKICFLIPYFGKLPNYTKLFLKSCDYNPTYDFIFFSDLSFPEPIPPNVIIFKISLQDFSNLILNNTGLQPTINFGWKICDFRPAYGVILQEYIQGYNFWGIIDTDIILGKIDDYITDKMLTKYDVISASKFWLSGSFAIFRNTEQVNNLFKLSKDWNKVFAESRHYAFDECGRLIHKKGELVYKLLEAGTPLSEIQTDIESFTHILKNESKLMNLNVLFSNMNCEKLDNDTILEFNQGNLLLLKGKLEQKILYYHFVNDKNHLTFHIPRWKTIPDEYFITNYAFFKKKHNKYKVIIYIWSLYKGIIKLVFSKLPQKVIKKIFN